MTATFANAWKYLQAFIVALFPPSQADDKPKPPWILVGL